MSTQFTPIAEGEFVRNEILAPFAEETGISVELLNVEYAEFAARIEAEYEAGAGEIALLCGLHGDLAPFSYALADVSGVTPGGTIGSALMSKGYMAGKQVYIPLMQATYLMVVNVKALAYLPAGVDIWALTYEDLLAWARNIYEATGEQKLGIPAGPRSLLHRFIHGYLYPSFTGYQVLAFDSAAAVDMWNYMQELWQYVSPAAPTWDAMDTPLLAEEVWIAWDHTARVKEAIVQRPNDFIAIPSPAGPAGRGFISVLAGLAIPETSPDPDAAAQLIEYLTTPEVQVKILEGVGFFPVVAEAAGAVPAGALQVLATGVSAQAASPDAIVCFIPGGISDEYKKIYRDTFHKFVIQGEPVDTAYLRDQATRMRELYLEAGVAYPAPDGS
ncbi:TPA: carbohydrate ABC transporter substrate-binding protein [Candidatus Bipolaricaulota bacterium]|nr:carbohydrate ABC transporter substrate-binding protein [Candidatus Bipolaricaulota bacterium]